MKLQVVIVTILLSIGSKGVSQDYPSKEYDLGKLAEYIFPVQDLDINYSELFENLAQILSNPFDLNTVTDEQLRSLYILNELQVSNFITYRNEQSRIISVYELQSIPDFDESTISKLIPFVTVRTESENIKSLMQRVLSERNNYLLLRYQRVLENKRGFSNNPSLATNYAGSADRIYSRFRVSRSGDFSIGFTMEKDAGETVQWSKKNKQYGFDYYSYHIQLLNKGIFRNITIGDYQSQFGQGLVLGGGFGVGKGAETITTVRRGSTGFLPYTSLNETGFFRGIAVSLKPIKNISLDAFFSRNRRDGSGSLDSTNFSLSSFSSTGLHRTPTELSNRKILLATDYGGSVSYKLKSLEIGSIFHRTEFNLPIIRTPALYNQFYFQGSDNTNVSVYFNYAWRNLAFFGEAGHTLTQGSALVIGALTSLSSHFDLAMLYRHYDRNYQSFYGNSFSENTTLQNEAGYYLGWKYKFNKQHTLAGYSDLFQFPWLRYRGYAPSTGHEWLVRYAYQPNKSVYFYLQAREESKIRNRAEDINLYSTENAIKRNYWVNLDYSPNTQLSFKWRAQLSTFDFGNNQTSGFALIQDINYQWRKFSFSARYALFDTDDYDNRQYAYERDVWLAYSFPFYNGVGVRNYVLVQYAATRKIDLWMKWSRIQYQNQETIGSGSEMIEGNSLNDIKLQARIRF